MRRRLAWSSLEAGSRVFSHQVEHGLRSFLERCSARPGKQRQGTARAREIGGLVGGEDSAIDPHIADADIVEPGRACAAGPLSSGTVVRIGAVQLIGLRSRSPEARR